jgi:hypothetical protein
LVAAGDVISLILRWQLVAGADVMWLDVEMAVGRWW